ncbi:unnamed protein product [Orchesella dallaii]|uniref:Chitin-binding type-2 domain-containing protein n=1 Tax=Orchesella dallaii TaxID=48710 RepID=A0ABP1PYQ5_9HEXA
MSSKWCASVLLLCTIANGPSLIMGSGRGDILTLTEVQPPGNNSRSGLRKSGSLASEFLVIKSSLGGDERLSKVRRIRRETSTEYLKVKVSSGSYVYRPVPTKESHQNSTRELTRVPRGNGNKKKAKGGYSGGGYSEGGYSEGGYVSGGYIYTTSTTTTPAPVARVTTEENDAVGLPPPALPDTDFNTQARTTTTTEDPTDIRDNIPGEPGRDYQAYSSIPKTSFTCEGRAPGFYADVEAGCQVFHRCTDDPWYTGQVRVIMDSFLCPNGSLFNQQILSCDWWGNTDCNGSAEFYEINQQLGQLEETDAGTVQYVKFTGIRVPPPPGTKKVAPTIIPKADRLPLDPKYKSNPSTNNTGNGASGSRPLENDEDLGIIEDFEGVPDGEYRPLNSQFESIEDREGSSQNLDEVKESLPKKSRRKSSKKATTTTPAPTSSSEESSEETQQPSAATNSNARPLVVNRDRGENTEAATPPADLLPPEFAGDPVQREDSGNDDDDDDRGKNDRDSNSPNPSKQDYLPPRDEYLPPKESRGYSYPKPDKEYLPPPDKDYLPPPDKDYLPPSGIRSPDSDYLPPGEAYVSGTSPSTNQYLPPTTQRPGRDYLPPDRSRDSYAPQGLHTYSTIPDSYYRKPSTGYGQPVTSPYSDYLPPTPPSREYGQPNAGRDYLPPSRDYGTPRQQSRDYLPPKKDYLPPPKEYGTPQRGEYLPPKKDYLPPRPGYGTPTNDYLPPSKDYGTPKNKEYLPPQRSNDYLPPKNDYLPPKNDYLPPKNDYLPPKNDYLPPKNDYLPPKSQPNDYLPPKPQSSDYLPPQPSPYSYGTPQSGTYTFYPDQTTVTEHWPAKFAFEAPVTPNSLFASQNYASNYASSGPNFAYQYPRTHYDGSTTPYSQQPTAPSKDYGQPQHQSHDYLPPRNSYPPPSSYNDYLPPRKPNDSYLPPQKPGGDYGPPRPGSDYLPHQKPNGDYGPPRPGNDYLPPQKPNGDYGPPRPGNDNSPPRKPNGDYGPPRPGNDYLPPQKPNGDYGPPRPGNDYLPPQKPNGDSPRPGNDYLPPQKPNGDYGPPRPGNDYLPPQKPNGDYGPPKPGNDYLPPQKPNGDYGPPRPGNDYLPPQKPNGDYGPPRPGNDYLPPQKPNGDYGPPRPGNDYLPPQKPNGDYGPPRPGNDYLPPQKPDKDYLPPQRPNNDYLPPHKPNDEYLPPQDSRGYSHPTTGGYSTLPDHILKDYTPGPTPPTSYSTIPDQTPPPIYDSGQPSGSGLYTINPPKIDIVSVPLVSYSHVLNPILAEFSPFKKR